MSVPYYRLNRQLVSVEANSYAELAKKCKNGKLVYSSKYTYMPAQATFAGLIEAGWYLHQVTFYGPEMCN
jgi:hypothetical protein